MSHAGDAAELHALGLLDPEERAMLERHIVGCPECLRRVGQAEESVAHMASALPWTEPSAELFARLNDVPRMVASARAALPQAPLGLGEDVSAGPAQRMTARWEAERRRSARLQLRSYVAALALVAAIVGLAFAGFRIVEFEAALRGDDIALRGDETALRLMARMPFVVLELTPQSDLAPKAKLLYARDGSWAYVLIEGNADRLHVGLTRGGKEQDLGPPVQRGDVASLLVAQPGKAQRVSLRDPSGIVASAALKP